MALFDLPRVPEPEVMDDSGEVEAYSSAAAQSYLDAIDNTFVEHALRLVNGCERGQAIDIGTGPGQIVIKLAQRLPKWKFVGADRSANMIAQANANLTAADGGLADRVAFQVADGNRLPFPNKNFDLILCNSVLHHLAEPGNLLAEMERLSSSGGAILLRDLRRPGLFAYPWHVRWHGRHYAGTMRQLYRESVRSAYTVAEVQRLLDSTRLTDARVFEHGSTHLGIERPLDL